MDLPDLFLAYALANVVSVLVAAFALGRDRRTLSEGEADRGALPLGAALPPRRPFELADLGEGRESPFVRLPEPLASAPFWEAVGDDHAPSARRRPALVWA